MLITVNYHTTLVLGSVQRQTSQILLLLNTSRVNLESPTSPSIKGSPVIWQFQYLYHSQLSIRLRSRTMENSAFQLLYMALDINMNETLCLCRAVTSRHLLKCSLLSVTYVFCFIHLVCPPTGYHPDCYRKHNWSLGELSYAYCGLY